MGIDCKGAEFIDIKQAYRLSTVLVVQIKHTKAISYFSKRFNITLLHSNLDITVFLFNLLFRRANPAAIIAGQNAI